MTHEHDDTQSLIRAALYLGVFGLLGAGVFARYLGPEAARAQRWRLWYLLSGGFLLAAGATVYGVYHVTWMLGDTSVVGSYLAETSQGNLLLVRLGLLAGLLALSMGWLRQDRWLYPPLALGLLLTLALTSHAAGGGPAQVLADLLHLGAGAVWGGGVLALAVAWPGTGPEANRAALTRLSRLGVGAVAAVALAGVFLAAQRLGSPAELTSTAYGQRLLLKLGLVGLVLLAAGLNRWWLLPRLRGGAGRAFPAVTAEALLIAGVLLASGFLASTQPPRSGVSGAPSTVDILETLGGNVYSGQLFGQQGVIHFFLEVKDGAGRPLAVGPVLKLAAAKPGQEPVSDEVAPYDKAQYHSALAVGAGGEWGVTLGLPGKTLEFKLGVPSSP